LADFRIRGERARFAVHRHFPLLDHEGVVGEVEGSRHILLHQQDGDAGPASFDSAA
jgi:hypothetical protein